VGSGLHGFWRGAETILGVLAAFILSLSLAVVSFVATLAYLVNADHEHLGYAAGLFVAGTVLAVVLIRTVSQIMQRTFPAWEGRKRAAVTLPRAVFLATRRLRCLPWPLRLLLALWWLAHFASGVLVVVGSARWAEAAFPRGSVARVLVPQLLGFGFIFAANLFFLLALALMSERPTLAERWWRWRVLLDLLMLLAGVLIIRALAE
jgi:hypothetical protein